jgi:hypothetical protein
MDGEYVPVKFTSPEKDLKESEVLIFLDEVDRQIFIWTGSSSSVRKRFISSQIARQMRMERGLTHRISTEDQGNETVKFQHFMDSLKDLEINASALLEVSPPSVSTDLPEQKAKEVITRPSTSRKAASAKTKIPIKAKSELSPKKPPIAITKQPPSVTIKSKEFKIEYYCVEETAAVTESKAKILFNATDKNLIFSTLHISTAATKGRIAIYNIPKKTKTAMCTKTKPILAIYLKEGGNPIIESDDLNIPIPAGNSIYFTCPAKTFIGINLES